MFGLFKFVLSLVVVVWGLLLVAIIATVISNIFEFVVVGNPLAFDIDGVHHVIRWVKP